eukprot:Gb_01822 [translate_table: standard]
MTGVERVIRRSGTGVGLKRN